MKDLYTNKERMAQWITVLLITTSIIVRGFMGIGSIGELVISGYAAYVIFILFLVIALYPVTGNIVEKGEAKKTELKKCRRKHHVTLAYVSFAVCLMLDVVILFVEP